MSCFVCNEKTLSVISRAFVDYGVEFNDGNEKPTMCLILVNNEVERIFKSLLKTNLDAYFFRYSSEEKNYSFLDFAKPVEIDIDPGKIIGCIECFNYQATELPDYETTFIYDSLKNLKEKVYETLLLQSGYEVPYGIY